MAKSSPFLMLIFSVLLITGGLLATPAIATTECGPDGNDSSAKATPVVPMSIVNGCVSPADPFDWYLMDLGVGDSVEGKLTIKCLDVGLVVRVYKRTPTGDVQLGEIGKSKTPDDIVFDMSSFNLTPAVYLLRVTYYSTFQTEHLYLMDLDVYPVGCDTDTENFIDYKIDSKLAANDGLKTAKITGQICTEDLQDGYIIYLADPEIVHYDLVIEDNLGAIKLTVQGIPVNNFEPGSGQFFIPFPQTVFDTNIGPTSSAHIKLDYKKFVGYMVTLSTSENDPATHTYTIRFASNKIMFRSGFSYMAVTDKIMFIPAMIDIGSLPGFGSYLGGGVPQLFDVYTPDSYIGNPGRGRFSNNSMFPFAGPWVPVNKWQTQLPTVQGMAGPSQQLLCSSSGIIIIGGKPDAGLVHNIYGFDANTGALLWNMEGDFLPHTLLIGPGDEFIIGQKGAEIKLNPALMNMNPQLRGDGGEGPGSGNVRDSESLITITIPSDTGREQASGFGIAWRSVATGALIRYFPTAGQVLETNALNQTNFIIDDGKNIKAMSFDAGQTGVVPDVWNWTSDGLVPRSLATDAEGNVFGNMNGFFIKLSPAGRILLNQSIFTSTRGFFSETLVNSNGVVFLADEQGKIYAINGSNGLLIWSAFPELMMLPEANLVYKVRTDDTGLSQVEFGDGVAGRRLPSSSSLVRKQLSGAPLTGMALLPDGRLVVAYADKLCVFGANGALDAMRAINSPLLGGPDTDINGLIYASFGTGDEPPVFEAMYSNLATAWAIADIRLAAPFLITEAGKGVLLTGDGKLFGLE